MLLRLAFHILPILCIVPASFARAAISYYYDPVELSDTQKEKTPPLDGRTATPSPYLLASNQYQFKDDFEDRNPVRANQFKANSRQPQKFSWQRAATADDILRRKLLDLLKEAMMELEWKINFLKSLYNENKSQLANADEIVDYVTKAYGDLGELYVKIDENQRLFHPVNILGAYDQLRKSNRVMSSILGLVHKRFSHKKPSYISGTNKAMQGIAWSYYDENLD